MKVKIYINTILCAALHGCKKWSLSLTPRKGYRLKIFDNTVMTKIFGPNVEKVTGDWRRMHNKELNYLGCSIDIIHMIKSRRMSLVEHVAYMEEKMCIQVLVWGT
jgi:hypothetical protein